jgi:fatty-acyl-CoA synthase
MKISFSTLSCPRWNWGEIAAAAHDLQYDGIEIRGVGKDISAPSVPEFGPGQLEKTMEKLRALSLSIPCLDSDCLLYQRENLERTALEVKTYVDLAHKLSSPYVRVFAAPPVPQPMGSVDEGFVRETAQEFADYAGSKGIMLLLETHGVWADSKKLNRLVESINSKSVGILWDVHHPYRHMKESVARSFDNIKDYVKHVHLKDSVAENGVIKYKMMGYGDMPVAEAISLLHDHGYQGYLSLEWVKRWYAELEEPGIVFYQYKEAITKMLDRLKR